MDDVLLGSPKLDSGTGEEAGKAVTSLLSEWGLSDCVEAMCADTTSANTGRIKGACTVVENMIGKDLLFLACRHHMFEVVLKGVFEAQVAPSSGPDVLLFRRFRDNWPKIDQRSFSTGLENPKASPFLSGDNADSMMEFLALKVNEQHSSGDYKELLELAIIYLGGSLSRGGSFHAPGPVHDALWMARAIYAIKIMLFKKQFRLTEHEEEGLRQVCLFVVLIYAKAWFTATSAVTAPFHDLNFMRRLLEFREVNEKTAQIALAKFVGHLWYLVEEFIPMSLFDPAVLSEEKSSIVRAMKTVDGCPHKVRRLQVQQKDIQEISKKTLADLASKKSLDLFKRFRLPTSFLWIPTSEWESNIDYQRCSTFFSDLKVVNDVAERGVALTQEYVTNVKEEKNKQHLLLVAHDYRKNHSKSDKANLAKKF